ncbi:thermonuclease family protein [Pseudooceanicola sp. C21-150M6]|uniref:thermonuclease family protein n=1 Tax=Pseudooceanicola sp. C21-150M6 TaxID=3434355 RepID=UPI003D7F1E90
MSRIYHLDDHFARAHRRSRALRPPRLSRRLLVLPVVVALALVVTAVTEPEQFPPRGARAPSDILSGRVSHVRDGDTIEVVGQPVRIANLDCAEMETAAGRRARARMVELTARGHMLCALEGRRSWDREIATCALPDGRDLGDIMIGEGLCSRWK